MILLKNGILIDGTGAPRRQADVLIENDKIVEVAESGKLQKTNFCNLPDAQIRGKAGIQVNAHNRREEHRTAQVSGQIDFKTDAKTHSKADIKADTQIFDISGKIICPGFMDIHAHSELEVLRNPSMPYKIAQGITFDLSGNCGVGVYPRKPNNEPCFADILGHWDCWNWTDFESFAQNVKTGMNIGFLQSHAALRKTALDGNPNRSATNEEIQRMCELLETSMLQGCFGFSTGLYYAPCLFADKTEMLALLKTVKKHNGIFTVHHRCEGDEILSSIDEIIFYTKETGVQTEISHLKAIGTENQNKVDEILGKIHRAKAEGYDIGFDQYPYEYGSTSLFSLLPPKYLRLQQPELLDTLSRALSDGSLKNDLIFQMQNPDGWDSITKLCGFENITAVILENSPDFSGLTLSQCADKLHTDPYTALFTLLAKETKCALMADITQSTENLRKIMQDDLMCFGTDALYAGQAAHPRSTNAAIHLLTENCIKTKTLSFEEAIRKMTGEVAKRLHISDRGIIRKGNYADVTVFDPNSLKDNSSLKNPFAQCSGLEHVIVNGEFAIKNSKLTGSLSGKVL